jgi:cytochrome P450
LKEAEPSNADAERTIFSMDPPEHGPARRAVMGHFTARRATALRPQVQKIVDDRIDAILNGPSPVDLVSALSLPVASGIICDFLPTF